MEVYLPNFGRSSHNIGKIIRTTQACGTIVPYWCQIGLDGTTFYIDITTKVKTLPTTGPVFGSFKHQIDVFVIPIRLYIAALHNNALGVGLNMSKVLLPQFEVYSANTSIYKKDTNRGQVKRIRILCSQSTPSKIPRDIQPGILGYIQKLLRQQTGRKRIRNHRNKPYLEDT